MTQYYFITAYDFSNKESGSSNLTIFTPIGSPPVPPPPLMGTVSLELVGNPATGPWGVEVSTTDPRNVMVSIGLDGIGHHTKHTAPYGFPGDNGTTVTTGRFGPWSHTVEFVFYEEGTTTEIGRASITVLEGSPSPSPIGENKSGARRQSGHRSVGRGGLHDRPTECHGVGGLGWGRASYQTYCALWLPWRQRHNGHDRAVGPLVAYRVEFVFYVEGTMTEIGRASMTVREGSP